MILNYKVEKESQTVNNILKQNLDISSRLFSKLINNKLVKVNGQIFDTRNIVHKNDIISIDLNYPEDNSNIIPTNMNLNIIYEDDSFIILNKPAGIAVHPSFSHFNDTLSNGLKFYFDKINLHKKIRPVNRLDLNTSGLIIFAKNEYVQETLIKQMNNKTFKKEYLAVVCGKLSLKKETINKPIARKENSIIERCISNNGKQAITHFEVLKEYDTFSLIKCVLETGRTHQIRVHFASISHPLLGDVLYGGVAKVGPLKRQALHSSRIEMTHPITKELLEITVPLPTDMQKLI